MNSNKFSFFFVLCLGLLLTNTHQSFAQVSRRPVSRSPQKETVSFADRLWYGGGFSLSFSGGLNGLDGNTFAIGISPMVGFKLTPFISVGPRFEFLYTTGRFRNSFSGPVTKYNGIDYGAGVFTRAKFLSFLFAHAETNYINRVYPTGFNGNKIETERIGDNQTLIGLGYTSGGVFKSEILLLYDLTADSQSTNLPLVYRFGFTYNF
ncbi:MAG: hypothetical protein SH818_08700 [Saprospiraceae bacterium]|nr:hypothetical protein [Saprospiraceae bacterium]